MMKQIFKLSLCALPFFVGACESGAIQETLGIQREAPDEFSVVSRPPLSVPPEFSLRPPGEGSAPLSAGADEQARSLITGKAAAVEKTPADLKLPAVSTAVTPVLSNDALSGGATSLLKKAGAGQASETIRQQLGEDARTPVDTSKAQTLLDQISGAEKNEPTVDAKKESERLRGNKDGGKPLTEGEVPIEKPAHRSLLDRIF